MSKRRTSKGTSSFPLESAIPVAGAPPPPTREDAPMEDTPAPVPVPERETTETTPVERPIPEAPKLTKTQSEIKKDVCDTAHHHSHNFIPSITHHISLRISSPLSSMGQRATPLKLCLLLTPQEA
jgi:hypothetical protein